MKKIILLLTIISVIAFQSCKKDEITNPDRTSRAPELSSIFNPNNIDNMNEYLFGFINNMKMASKGDDTSFTLEEAEWHLTACLNYQHCNANTSRINMEYDTIISYININNNRVSLVDISNSFIGISKEVQSIYSSYDFENKQIVYIYSTIDKDNNTRGESVVRTVMATVNNDYFYLNDWQYSCIDTIFPFDNTYHWRVAADSLKYYVKHVGTLLSSSNFYYVNIQQISYLYSDYVINPSIERFGYVYKNRLFAERSSHPDTHTIKGANMAFYVDSYLGLIKNEDRTNKEFIDLEIECDYDYVGGRLPYILYHNMTGMFGTRVINNDNNNPST